ncbi:MAG: UDP-glucose 4-epimerase GalE [Microbacteriaceae bacterium]|jgi:UDP-glucose 4-epimerase|nr:UDP-glucose 4-epimerase GalE [Microbacteriaceae bacterium]HQJ33579.1 UDP-glucose 4-epimerase GalE [Rhodoglobus sp.]
MSIMVTGGAGYIGAHLCDLLVARGESVVIVDDLATGSAARVPGIPIFSLDVSEASAPAALAEVITGHDVEAVIHFAARKQVAESVERPNWYRRQNVTGLTNLLAAMRATAVSRLVFSSSAAVYGNADGIIAETRKAAPSNPYGQTKLDGERMISAASDEWGIRAVSLRYFNVGGAARPELGDTQALNLIPIVFDRLASGSSPVIFGDDYPTPDGTCVRDFVHVSDVADAHQVVLDHLPMEPGHKIYNIGTGVGTSVREMVDALIDIAGSDLKPVASSRRPGDSATVVADVSRIRQEMGWVARHDLESIISSAWESREYFGARS